VLARTLALARPSTIAATTPEWLEFAAGHPEAAVFHHPAWIALLARSYGYKPGVFALLSDDGGILAGLPFVKVSSRLTGSRHVALPFTDHMPPVCAPGREIELANALQNWASETALVVHARISKEDQHLVCAGVRHLLQLDEAETRRVKLSKTPVGRALRKANKSELTTSVERDMGGVRAYYRLHCLTRRRQGVPVQPWRFFRLLHQILIAAGLGMVVLARFHGRPVAGAVFLSWNSTLIYKYGASDTAFLELRPNNLVMLQAIEWGSTHGIRTLDFGKTDQDNVGLRRFKSGWGGEEVPLHHTIFPDGADPKRSGLAMRSASQVIRRSSVVAARAIGELLHGHYA
jgi:CelD/BcsL family acetyltransferase involved in cellulose biosynthesis